MRCWREKIHFLINNYLPCNIYNFDETGLFYRGLPSRTLCISSDKCKNGKFSKERITIGLCCNLDGTDKLRPIVIGKSAKPRCFRKIKSESLPVVWRANKKA